MSKIIFSKGDLKWELLIVISLPISLPSCFGNSTTTLSWRWFTPTIRTNIWQAIFLRKSSSFRKAIDTLHGGESQTCRQTTIPKDTLVQCPTPNLLFIPLSEWCTTVNSKSSSDYRLFSSIFWATFLFNKNNKISYSLLIYTLIYSHLILNFHVILFEINTYMNSLRLINSKLYHF